MSLLPDETLSKIRELGEVWESPKGDVVLVNADCLEVLPLLPDKCVDAVVTDPPYGIDHPTNYNERGRGFPCGKQWPSRDYPKCHGDSRPFNPQSILDLSVPAILWGANHFASRLPDSSGWLVWDKCRPDDLDQSTCELAWTNCIKGVRRFRHLWNGLCRDSEIGEHLHPMQKPVALYEWIFSLRWMTYTTILDLYLGSGPTAVACIRTGRKCIGIELDPKYYEIAVKRCRDEYARTALLDGVETVEVKRQLELIAQ